MNDRSKILEKVRKLLDKAASTNFGPEALAFQQKADQLMMEWAVEEFELSHKDPRNMAYQPEVRKFDFSSDIRASRIWSYVFRRLVNFTRCKLAVENWDQATVVGYPGDLDYLENLCVVLQLHIIKTIFPKPDPNLTEAENLYNLRMAGNTWDQCYRLLHPGMGAAPKSERVRYTKVVGKYATANNLPRNMTASQSGYTEQFLSSFGHRLAERLEEIMRTQDEENKYALVLRDRASDLDEFLWTRFPDLRPHPKDCDCEIHHRCSDPKCARCAWRYKPVKTRGGGSFKTIAYNPAAHAAGKRAANNADLGQTRVGGGERKQVN